MLGAEMGIPRRSRRASQLLKLDLDWRKHRIADRPRREVQSREEIRANVLGAVQAELGEKRPGLREGQALGILFRLFVINLDGSLRDEIGIESNVSIVVERHCLISYGGGF